MEQQLDTSAFAARESRRPVSMRGIAMSPNGGSRDSDIIMADISYAGCQFRSDDSFEPGEQVELRMFRRGLIHAEVRWVRDDRVGARFLG